MGRAACCAGTADYPQQVVDVATTTGIRPIDIDLDPDTEKLRSEIRAEVAALKEIPRDERKVAIAEGGWVTPHLPKPWGRSAKPIEQIIIAQEFAAGKVQRPPRAPRSSRCASSPATRCSTPCSSTTCSCPTSSASARWTADGRSAATR